MDTKLRSWVNREGSAPRMWQRWTDEDDSLADEAVAQWNGRPREERRVSAVKRYIRELAVRWGRSENAVRDHLRGRLMVAVARRPSVAGAMRGPGSAGGREQRPQDGVRNGPLEEFLRSGNLEAYRSACHRR